MQIGILVSIYFTYYFWGICKWQLVHFEVVCKSLLTSFRVKIYASFAFIMPSHANLTIFDYMANPKTNNSLYAHKHKQTETHTCVCVRVSKVTAKKKLFKLPSFHYKINMQYYEYFIECVYLPLSNAHTHT